MKHELNNFTIYIQADYEAMSDCAAQLFADEIKKEPDGIFGFATGGTPVGMYKRLIEEYKAKELDFSRITTFNLDEYYPISKKNDQSYSFFMHKYLFDHVNIRPESINLPDGEAADSAAECRRYSEKISDSGGICLQILGIGNNGHIGFNEPDHEFAGATHLVDLDETTIEANARFFKDIADVPRSAITMGIREIMSAKKILLLASGSGKAEIVHKTLTGPITPKIPASVLQLHQNVMIVLDREAAAKLIEELPNDHYRSV